MKYNYVLALASPSEGNWMEVGDSSKLVRVCSVEVFLSDHYLHGREDTFNFEMRLYFLISLMCSSFSG